MKRSVPPACGLLVLLAAGAFCAPAWALRSGDGGTWERTTNAGPDAQVPGWFINLGITGARAKIPDDKPKILEVTFVFKDTPAAGKLKAGDKIAGANGKRFVTPHKFGYGVDKFGYEGPMMDFGNALEASQSERLGGKLTLDVVRDGHKKQVELKLPTKYGRYSKTYPYNCPKTSRILAQLYPYLIKRQNSDGAWHGRPHINAFATLALMGSGQRKYMPAVKKAVQAMARSTGSKIDYGGLDCWKYGLYGTVLGEYHLLTGEKWVLRELEEINRWLAKAQFDKPYRKGRGTGGWGHRPKDRPGGNGYGPICMITAQAMTAWSLMAQCGIEIDRKRFNLAHEFLAKGTNNIGYVWYADGNGGDNKYADMARTGGSAVAHAMCPFGGKPFQDFALRNARCIGNNPKTFPDTHGSPILGMAWTALGAAVDPPSFRKLMDHNRWSFSLAHCPDGTFYYQPNRDNNAQDYSAAPRLAATAATALIFSVKYKRLQMTGAKATMPELIAAKVQAVRSAEKGGKHAQAWQECRRLGKMVYDGTPERAFHQEALARLQKTGTKLAGQLAARSPSAPLNDLRAFLKEWEGCDGLQPVRRAANACGEQQLARLLAGKRGTAEAIHEFLRDWGGYPVAEKARKALADKGEKELTDLTARGKPSLTRLKAFETKWAGTPAAAKAKAMVNDLAKADLERILSRPPNAVTYKGFLKRWKGYPVHDDAAAKFNTRAKALLHNVDSGSDAERARNLKYFAASWEPLSVAEEARKRRSDIAAGMLREIMKLAARRTKYSRLRGFIRTYGDTSAADDARDALKEVIDGAKK